MIACPTCGSTITDFYTGVCLGCGREPERREPAIFACEKKPGGCKYHGDCRHRAGLPERNPKA